VKIKILVFCSLIVKKWWFVCPPCVCQSQLSPRGLHQSVSPHPPPISLDINRQCGGHLSRSELNIAALKFRQSSSTSAPRTVWWQKTSKGGQKWVCMVPD